MIDRIRQRFNQSADVLHQSAAHLALRLTQASGLVIDCYRTGGKLLLFGNGGSAADAQHIACEMVGRFLKERPGLPAVALPSEMAAMSGIGNDYDYASIFARQVQALGGASDVAIGLSTSGNSANVVRALEQARKMGMKTIAFTGAGGGKCAALADILLDVPSKHTPRVQEAHAVCYHILCELVEEALTANS